MRKISMIIFIFSISMPLLFAGGTAEKGPDSDMADSEVVEEVEELIEYGLSKTEREVREKSNELTEEQRAYLFEEYERKVGLNPLLNVIPGYGLGSSIQGDKSGSTILAVSTAAGAGLTLGGVIWSLSAIDIDLTGGGGSAAPAGATILAVSGGIVLLATGIAGVLFPILHAPDYNERLRYSLRMLGD